MNIRHCMRRGLSAGLACLLLFAASCSPDADMPGTTTGTDRETGTAAGTAASETVSKEESTEMSTEEETMPAAPTEETGAEENALTAVPAEELIFDKAKGVIKGIDADWLAKNKDKPLSVAIPAEIDGVAVTSIGQNAFNGKKL